MSHEIGEFDSAIRPQSAERSWHGLEKVYPGEITSADQIPNVAFDVVAEPMILPDNYVLAGQNCSRLIVAKKPDQNVVIATCSPEYEVFSNKEILERVFEAFGMHDIPAKFSYGVTIKNCSQVAFSFEIENASEFFCAGGKDRHKMYINFLSSHDKTMGLKGFGSAVRTVCNNTIQLALRSQKELFSFTFFHSKQGRKSFEMLPMLIEATQHHAQAYSELAEKLGNKPINMHQARAIALEILSSKQKEEKLSTRNYNASEKIANLFKNGKGNSGQNMFDLLNGVTEYYTSGDGSGGKTVDKFKKVTSSEFGNAAETKVLFLNAFQDADGDAISDEMLNSLIKRGEALLKMHEMAAAAV